MIIFLYGEDAFRISRKVSEIKQKYLNSDKSASGLSVFDCEDDKKAAGKIIDTALTPNLLSPKRLIIVKNLLSFPPTEEQKKFLESLKKKGKALFDDQDSVIVLEENSKPKKSGSLFKFLEKNAKSQEFEKLTGSKLKQWVLKELAGFSPAAKISARALEKLTAYCGENTGNLFLEVCKLADSTDGMMIEEKDVEMMVRAKIDGNIFQMIDALGRNDKRIAMGLLHRHLAKGDDPFYVLSMFFYQFRNMLKIADLREQGFPEGEIVRATNLHPFVVKKSLAQTARLSSQKLKVIYGKLGKLDTDVKTGKIDIRLGLDKFVVEL